MSKSGFFTNKEIHDINKEAAKKSEDSLKVFDEPVYMSFVVTPKERAIIQDFLNQYKGKTLTEQLLCVIKKHSK